MLSRASPSSIFYFISIIFFSLVRARLDLVEEYFYLFLTNILLNQASPFFSFFQFLFYNIMYLNRPPTHTHTPYYKPQLKIF